MLTPLVQTLLHQYIIETDKQPDDYLFTPHYDSTRHLKAGSYRKMFKRWLSAVAIDPTRYGTHSLRRTQGQFFLDKEIEMRALQTMKGHSSILTTESYYDLPVLCLEEAMRKYPILPSNLKLEDPPDAKKYRVRHSKKFD